MRLPSFKIDVRKSTALVLVVRDLGPWDQFPTITNAAEELVEHLHETDVLAGRRLFYYDSEGELGELLHRDGRFGGFAPAPRGALDAKTSPSC